MPSLKWRVTEYITSSAVNLAPSCHSTSLRKLKTQDDASAFGSQDVAKKGAAFRSGPLFTNQSWTQFPIKILPVPQ